MRISNAGYEEILKAASIPVETQFLNAIVQSGITVPSHVVGDGRIHRYPTNGRRGDTAGYYLLNTDATIPYGWFGDWRENGGKPFMFTAVTTTPLTQDEYDRINEERVARQKEFEKAEKARKKAVASVAAKIWENTRPAPENHPYLVLKRVGPHGVHVDDDGELVIPMYSDGCDSPVSIEYIRPDGTKRFHGGGAKKGCYFYFGNPESTDCYLCEGFATGASVYEATGVTTYVAFDAGNLASVAPLLTTNGQVVIVEDNDSNGTGRIKGHEAAVLSGAGELLVPKPETAEKMDANDYACQYGLESLKAFLTSGTVDPRIDSWLVPAEEFFVKAEPVRWLVKGWFRKGVNMIHGPSGSGKTFVVLDLALTLATGGESWFGLRCHPCAPVVYLCGEGFAGVRLRVRAWAKTRGLGGDSLKGKFYVSRGPVDIDKPEGCSQIEEAVKRLNISPQVIIVDTLNRFFSGDENKAQEARNFLNNLSALQKLYKDASIIVIHHTGLAEDSQKRGRGSSAWRAAMDTEVSVTMDPDTRQLTIEQEKQKDGEMLPPLYAGLRPVSLPEIPDEDGDPSTSAVLQQGEYIEPPKRTEPVPEKNFDAIAMYTDAFMLYGDWDSMTLKRKDLEEWLMKYYGVESRLNQDVRAFFGENQRGGRLKKIPETSLAWLASRKLVKVDGKGDSEPLSLALTLKGQRSNYEVPEAFERVRG